MNDQITTKSDGETSALVSCAISGQSQKSPHTLTIWRGMSSINIESPPTKEQRTSGHSTRGNIENFSRRSRKRMLETFQQKRDGWVRPIFITLTYTDEAWFGGCSQNPQLHWERLRHWFNYNHPEVCGMRRIEWEVRKSGQNVGQYAPHLHLVVDGYMGDLADLRKTLAAAWHSAITDNNTEIGLRPRIDVQRAKNTRHAMYYLSKYVAKTDGSPFSENPSPHKGRWWSIFGPYDDTPIDVIHITHEEFIQMRRLVSSWLKSKGNRYAKTIRQSGEFRGFSVFGLGSKVDKDFGGEVAELRRWLAWYRDVLE